MRFEFVAQLGMENGQLLLAPSLIKGDLVQCFGSKIVRFEGMTLRIDQ